MPTGRAVVAVCSAGHSQTWTTGRAAADKGCSVLEAAAYKTLSITTGALDTAYRRQAAQTQQAALASLAQSSATPWSALEAARAAAFADWTGGLASAADIRRTSVATSQANLQVRKATADAVFAEGLVQKLSADALKQAQALLTLAQAKAAALVAKAASANGQPPTPDDITKPSVADIVPATEPNSAAYTAPAAKFDAANETFGLASAPGTVPGYYGYGWNGYGWNGWWGCYGWWYASWWNGGYWYGWYGWYGDGLANDMERLDTAAGEIQRQTQSLLLSVAASNPPAPSNNGDVIEGDGDSDGELIGSSGSDEFAGGAGEDMVQLLPIADRSPVMIPKVLRHETDFEHYPADAMEELIKSGIAVRSSDGRFVFLVDVVGYELRYYMFEPANEVFNKPVVAMGRVIGMEPIGYVPIYRMVKIQFLAAVDKEGRLELTGEAVVDAIARLRGQQSADLWEKAYFSWEEHKAIHARMAVYEGLAKMVPGVATHDYWEAGDGVNCALSFVGDVALLLSGPLAAYAKAGQAFQLARAASAASAASKLEVAAEVGALLKAQQYASAARTIGYVGAGIDGGLGAVRIGQAIYEVSRKDGDTNVAAGYLGEGVLRMFGAIMQYRQAAAVRSVTVAPSRTWTISDRVRLAGATISDDALVNFGSVARNEIAPTTGARSYWFRYGDIRDLTHEQLQAVIGDLASAGRPGGANVLRVSSVPESSFTPRPANNMFGIPEYTIDTPVRVVKSVPVVIGR